MPVAKVDKEGVNLLEFALCKSWNYMTCKKIEWWTSPYSCILWFYDFMILWIKEFFNGYYYVLYLVLLFWSFCNCIRICCFSCEYFKIRFVQANRQKLDEVEKAINALHWKNPLHTGDFLEFFNLEQFKVY